MMTARMEIMPATTTPDMCNMVATYCMLIRGVVVFLKKLLYIIIIHILLLLKYFWKVKMMI